MATVTVGIFAPQCGHRHTLVCAGSAVTLEAGYGTGTEQLALWHRASALDERSSAGFAQVTLNRCD